MVAASPSWTPRTCPASTTAATALSVTSPRLKPLRLRRSCSTGPWVPPTRPSRHHSTSVPLNWYKGAECIVTRSVNPKVSVYFRFCVSSSLCVSLSVCPCLCVFPFLCASVSVCFHFCVSLSLCVSVSTCPCLCEFPFLRFPVSVCPRFYVRIVKSIILMKLIGCTFVCPLSVCLCIYLSVYLCPSLRMYLYRFVCVFLCLSNLSLFLCLSCRLIIHLSVCL